ncbi:tyrosine-type recombinase/integrase [Robertmurraya andreesenii]|uniref:Site-specific recombinase XerD n=1 Tax=Anoxybacillus andreesenii TaxID=1325932 RepID=A0ABT9V006_9BACL|nr:tyrosine-type recombinase/integrase [Robertmurraya andreesenii]MDQ0154248.1 site-specific recombinase XerD [Robertmurraya andreesenii]
MNSDVILNQFLLEYQFRIGKDTLTHYLINVRQLLHFTGKSIDSVTKSDILGWLGYLKKKKYKPWTVWGKLTSLKTFFKYCLEEGYIHKNPAETIPFPRIEEKLPYYLSLDQLGKVRELLQGRLEERAILEVLYATGVRISELCAMKKEDINWSERIIHIPKGKYKKGRIVLFTRNCEEHLKRYLDSRRDNQPYVFLSVVLKNRPIDKNTVGSRFRKYSKCLEFKFTPHTIRYTFTAHLAQKGMPLECIQTLLGHEEPQQTRYYARLYNHSRTELYDEYM